MFFVERGIQNIVVRIAGYYYYLKPYVANAALLAKQLNTRRTAGITLHAGGVRVHPRPLIAALCTAFT